MDVHQRTHGDVGVLACSGRLNMVTAPSLKAAIATAATGPLPRLVIDMSEVTFVDSSGLGVLVGGLKLVRQSGGDLRIVVRSSQVLNVLALTNLDRILHPYGTVAEASSGW